MLEGGGRRYRRLGGLGRGFLQKKLHILAHFPHDLAAGTIILLYLKSFDAIPVTPIKKEEGSKKNPEFCFFLTRLHSLHPASNQGGVLDSPSSSG